ncbi:Putrescine-binding periplasmic protein precursor [compost metagenome]
MHYANGNAAAEGMVDKAILNDPMVYPPESVMKKLFVLEAMPLETDRLRTRVWSRVKNGQ